MEYAKQSASKSIFQKLYDWLFYKEPVFEPVGECVKQEQLALIFIRHRSLIQKKFKQAIKSESPETLCSTAQELVSRFNLFLCAKDVSGHELERWVGDVFKIFYPDGIERQSSPLVDFANWFRGLHEADEIKQQK